MSDNVVPLRSLRPNEASPTAIDPLHEALAHAQQAIERSYDDVARLPTHSLNIIVEALERLMPGDGHFPPTGAA